MRESERILIGEGGMGRTFRAPAPDGDVQAEKEFNVKLPQALLYRLFFGRPHPYSPENPNFPFALGAAVQRRHLAFLLSKVSSDTVKVLDAEVLEDDSGKGIGLKMPFVAGRPVTPQDESTIFELDTMAELFREMGLTDWNLRGIFAWLGWGALRVIKRGSENIKVTPDGKSIVVDNEEGFPVPDREWGGIRFDDVDQPVLEQGLRRNRERIVQRIGADGLRQFEAAATIERQYWNLFRLWERSPLHRLQVIAHAFKPNHLLATIDHLLKIDQITPQKAEVLKEEVNNLPPDYLRRRFRGIAPHLIAHNLTHLVPIPPPLDMIKHLVSSGFRAGYTLAAGGIEKLRREKQNVHTPLVAILSLVPGVGSLAYLIDLLPTENPDLSRLLLESVAYHGFSTHLDHLIDMAGKRERGRKVFRTVEAVLKRMAFLKTTLQKSAEEQFGHQLTSEVINDLIAKFARAARSKVSVSDEYPTEIYVGGLIYLVSWGEKWVIELNPETKTARALSRKEAKRIVDLFIRSQDLYLCQDLERVLASA